MDYGYIEDSIQAEIPDEIINNKLEEIINKPNSPVATKNELNELEIKLSMMDFGVF